MKDKIINRRKAIATLTGLTAAIPATMAGINKADKVVSETTSPQITPGEPLYQIRRKSSGQFTTFNPSTTKKAIEIKPGETKILVRHDSPGIIHRLWMTFDGWFWTNWDINRPVDQTILKKLILRIYWDGKQYPSIEAPLGDFFGLGLCEYKHYMSKYLGMSSGGFYCYFPMPFEKIRIEVNNMHETQNSYVFLNANYESVTQLPIDAGRFHCAYSAGTKNGEDVLPIFETKGRGHFVGCCLSMQSNQPNYLRFLEAPEYFYIDNGGSEVTIVGTGLEDYFNGGWYFRDGEFCGPLHGVIVKDALRSTIAMYRFHDEDAIFFDKDIKMTFLNCRSHLLPFKYSSTAYWYQESAVQLPYSLPEKEKLANWYRIRDTDHQSIP